MKDDLGIDRESLAARIGTEYGLWVGRIEFLPKGEVGYCYLIDSDIGLRYLVKVLPSTRMGLKSAKALDFCLPLMWNLFHGNYFRSLPCPVRTQAGSLKSDFGGMPVVVYNFIEGRTINDERPSDEVLATVARQIARIHNCAPYIGTENPPIDDLGIPFKGEMLTGLETLERTTQGDGEGKLALRDLILPLKEELLGRLGRLETLQPSVRGIKKQTVLCHTDPIGSNILIDARGEVYVLDWEGAILAPPEHDIFAFTGDRFDLFLDNYEDEFGRVCLKTDFLGFYLYRRILEDLVDWMIRILHENRDEDQNRRDLEGIIRDCISDLPHLEPLIERTDQVLRRREG